MELTEKEKNDILTMCLDNPVKSCAIVQCYIDNLQLVSCPDYAMLKGKSKRTIQYQSEKLTGIKINNQKFLSLNA